MRGNRPQTEIWDKIPKNFRCSSPVFDRWSVLNGNESAVAPWITMEGRSPFPAFSPDFQVLQEQFSSLWEEVEDSHGCVRVAALVPKGLFVHPLPVVLPCHPPGHGSIQGLWNTSWTQHLQCSPGNHRTLSVPLEITAECLLISLLQFSSAKPHCIQS